jgi:carbonic anhydrase
MRILPELFENNRQWAEGMIADDPDFFRRLERGQAPKLLWIGCSDSRVPANQIIGLPPGEVFVHRNVANLVHQSDMNCLSVMQFAVDVLQVEHVVVCGHYGCGGVSAALARDRVGLVDNWLRDVGDTIEQHSDELDEITDNGDRLNRLCELNVQAQVRNVCRSTVVQDAWHRGQSLSVHGWIYALHDGLLRDLGVTTERPEPTTSS